ncbi:amino acid permease [Hyphomicrobium album]|nr:amino acid permease [Hyphomicrobium album]
MRGRQKPRNHGRSVFMSDTGHVITPTPPHPRVLGWFGTSALAMGGSNQMIFIIGALFIGQGTILGQGSAAVPLLIVGVLLGWAAAPAWTELVLMWPNRVGGISAACAEAFRPYNPVLSVLTGTCYWWGWIPTCGLTALLSAAAFQHWYFPHLPVEPFAICIVLLFTFVNLCGIKWVARLAIPIATASATLAFLSGLIPIFAGEVDWQQAFTFHLTTPFEGWFGDLTSVMAGLYLIGFTAPAFEAAASHVGETKDPNRNVPRAMLASAFMAGIYFILLPVVWLGVLGPGALGRDLATVLGPTFAPLLGNFAKAAAIWFIVLNMFHGTLQPLAGAARTMSQLADDGLLPRFLSLRIAKTDCPWAATSLTAAVAIIFLLMGDPIWMIAAANFTYLIGICMPNIAAWLLRRDMPHAERPYRAPRGTIMLGVFAAGVWLVSAILGFQQFGLPTVVFGLFLAYSGAALYAWRVIEDRRREGLPALAQTLHVKLTGAMVLVLVLDGIAYLLAVNTVSTTHHPELVSVLADIFVVVALLTISVGLVLPGMITYSAKEVSAAAKRLTSGTLNDFSVAMRALGRGDLDAAHASVNIVPVKPNSNDELGEMADNFNVMQERVKDAAYGLDEARENMRKARAELLARHAEIAHLAHHDPLTNLPNRTLLAAELTEVFDRAKSRGESFAVLTVDLDHFKEANDVFGHVVGDELLCAIARRLEVAANGSFVARIGGDEFTLISAIREQPLAAQALANRLLQAVSTPFDIQGQHIPIGLSIGAAVYPNDGADTFALLANADAALYRAKESGRRTVRFFDPDLDRRLRDRFALQLDLRSALDRKELLLYYQPQAKIDGRVFGFEALARWNHPTRGMVPPTEFITLAEQNGTIVEIGAWALREACREAASWREPLQISVNLSPIQFRYGDLASLVHLALLDTGLSPDRLELEITEGVIFDDPSRALSVLRRLKSLGVKIAMDDFGTGYASMSSLQSFPFDKIKIDRSFVSSIETNAQSAVIVRSIIGLGEALRIPVIAEGVETEAERSILWQEGCTEIQGFLVGHPMPISAYVGIVDGDGSNHHAAQAG